MSKTGTFLQVPETQEGAPHRLVTDTAGEGLPVIITDGNGNPLSSYYSAATDSYVLNTHDADVHNVPVNQHFHQHTGISTTLTVATNADGSTYIITVADSTGFVAGEFVQIGGDANHTGIKIPIISVVGNVITLSARVDFGWPIGTSVEVVIIDMAVSGTLAAPQEFRVYPNVGQVIHITRVIITMTHSTAGDLGLFGDLAPLANGVMLRAFVNGQYGTFTLWRTNDEIKDDMYDVEFNFRASGGGTYGTSGRGSFNRIGVALRLDGDAGDYVEVYIQDASPVGLDSFHIKAQGHIEGS